MNAEVNCSSTEAFQRTVVWGMGCMHPMKRSGTAVELVAFSVGYRGRFASELWAVAARHDKQISVGGELMQ